MTAFVLLPAWMHQNHTRRKPGGDTTTGPCGCPPWAKVRDSTEPVEHCRCCGACHPVKEPA